MRGAKQLSSFFLSSLKNSSQSPLLKTLDKSTSVQINSIPKLKSKSKSKSKKSSKTRIESTAVSLSSSLREFQKQQQAIRESEKEGLTGESVKETFHKISGILAGGDKEVVSSICLPASDIPSDEDEELEEKNVNMPWFSNTPNCPMSDRHKVKSRGRKEKYVFRDTQSHRFQKLVNACGEKLGADATLAVFGKLKRETGRKEYKALINQCVEKARNSQDEDESLDNIHKAYRFLKAMREQGFQVKDEIFGPLLVYLIDMRMVEEFHFFCDVIKDGNAQMLPRLGYYEMLLWIRVDEDKVQELCNSVVLDADGINLAENYLLALCKMNREKEILQLLELMDITKISRDNVSRIFKSIGRISLEGPAEKLILALKESQVEEQNLSYFICNYAINMPDLVIEDVISKFECMHEKLDVKPSSISYEKLIQYCCNSLKVHKAFAIIERMCQLNLALSVEIFYPLISAVEQTCELDLVHPIYSAILRHNLKPKSEMLRILINLHVRMKDYEGAYNVLYDLKEMDVVPTAGMYNAIMAGYFREKKIQCAVKVYKQMKDANVKPDSKTFGYLISNSEHEKDIIKYFEEMQSAQVRVTKCVYMALINAYVNCGQFDKAKQVVLDLGTSAKNINGIKSALVGALASSKKMPDALQLYDEMKEDGHNLEPKAIISLIEYLQSEGKLNRLLELLEDLKDPDYWFDGCGRVVIYCIRHKHLASAIELLRKLKDHDEMSTYVVLDQVFCQIFEMGPAKLEIGVDLLKAVKEDLKLCPTRTSLDFLLSACVTAKDSDSARTILKQYEVAGFSYNVLTYLRIFQVLLACGEYQDAKKVLKNIPKDDPHVRSIIYACEQAFENVVPKKKEKGKIRRCIWDLTLRSRAHPPKT